MINEYNYVTIHLNWIKISCFHFHINDLVLNDHELTLFSFSIKLLCIMSSRQFTIKLNLVEETFSFLILNWERKKSFFFWSIRSGNGERAHVRRHPGEERYEHPFISKSSFSLIQTRSAWDEKKTRFLPKFLMMKISNFIPSIV